LGKFKQILCSDSPVIFIGGMIYSTMEPLEFRAAHTAGFGILWSLRDVYIPDEEIMEPSYSRQSLEKKLVNELQAILRRYGFRVSGSKAELIERIISHCGHIKQQTILLMYYLVSK